MKKSACFRLCLVTGLVHDIRAPVGEAGNLSLMMLCFIGEASKRELAAALLQCLGPGLLVFQAV